MKSSLPKRVQVKASQLRQQLEGGLHWSQIGGRKLTDSRAQVVFELPAHYRLICWYRGKTLYRTKAVSHERYNVLVKNSPR